MHTILVWKSVNLHKISSKRETRERERETKCELNGILFCQLVKTKRTLDRISRTLWAVLLCISFQLMSFCMLTNVYVPNRL